MRVQSAATLLQGHHSTNISAMKDDKHPYLVCMNPQCSLAQAKKAWIKDYGVGSVSDSVKCYGCKQLFRKRSNSQGSARSANDENNRRPKARQPTQPKTDDDFWKNKFKEALDVAKRNGGTLDIAALETLSAPPAPPAIVPGVSDLNKLKKQIEKEQRSREARHQQLRDNIKQCRQLQAEVVSFDSKIAELNEQFNQMVLDSKIVPVPDASSSGMDTTDFISIPNDVALWDDDLRTQIMAKMAEEAEYQSLVEHHRIRTSQDDKEEPPSSATSGYGKAAKGSGRSTPYGASVETIDDEPEDIFPEEYSQDMVNQHLEESALFIENSTVVAAREQSG